MWLKITASCNFIFWTNLFIFHFVNRSDNQNLTLFRKQSTVKSREIKQSTTTEDLAFPCVSPPCLEGKCQCCQVWVNAVRCDLITPAYLKVSSGLLARHKIDLHQGQALKATQAKQALHFEMQRPPNTGVGTYTYIHKALRAHRDGLKPCQMTAD